MDIITEESFTIAPEECHSNGLVRTDSLFRHMQNGAERSAESLHAGYRALQERGLFFVLTRTRIEVSEPIRSGEQIRHETWPGVVNRFFFPRHHRFLSEDGRVLAAASSLWVTLGVESRRMVVPQNSGIVFPDTSIYPSPVKVPLRIPECTGNLFEKVYVPVPEDFDINGHVNNASYVRWLCLQLDPLLKDNRFVSGMTVSYEKEIRGTDAVRLSLTENGSSFSFHVLDAEGVKHFSAGGILTEG